MPCRRTATAQRTIRQVQATIEDESRHGRCVAILAEIEQDEQAMAILRSVTALGTSLHISVFVDRAETAARRGIAGRDGCSAVQGYPIGRPSRALAEQASGLIALGRRSERRGGVTPVCSRIAAPHLVRRAGLMA